jgi:hypothetical protein
MFPIDRDLSCHVPPVACVAETTTGREAVMGAEAIRDACFECNRAEVNRLRARCLGPTAADPWPANPRPRPSKAAADRDAMLEETARRRRRAQIMARRALEAAEILPVAEPLAS